MTLSLAVALPGCSTQDLRIGRDDGSDSCHAYRVTLDSTGNYFGETMVQGAMIGALTGALAGLAAGRDVKAVGIGALAGAAVGAAGGYWVALQRNNANQAALVSQVSTDLQKENSQIDKTQIAFDQLVQCRRAQADQIRAQLRSGTMTRADADARMTSVRMLAQGDLEIARTINKNLTERSQNYAFANEQLNPQPYMVQTATYASSSPDGSGGRTFQVLPGRTYYASRVDDSTVKVYGPGNAVGYVPTTAVVSAPAAVEPTAPAAPAGRRAPARTRVATLPATPKPVSNPTVERDTSTNLAKRNSFERSIQTASAAQGTFELSQG